MAELSVQRLETLNRSRKRSFNPDQWKCNVAKKKRNSGEAYQSTSGVPVPGLQPPVQGKVCRDACTLPGCQISNNEKHDLWSQFWKMGKYEIRMTYLLGLLSKQNGTHGAKISYTIQVTGRGLELCRKSFLNVFTIPKSAVETLVGYLDQGILEVKDKRGLHRNRPHRVAVEIKEDMRDHLHSQPVVDVHYSRRRNGDSSLKASSISELFRDFTIEAEHLEPSEVANKEWLYREVIREDGLNLGTPRTDTCMTCDELHLKKKQASLLDRPEIEAQLTGHQDEADTAITSMYDDISRSQSDPDYVVKCIDMQQVLFSPNLTNSASFYKRKFLSYNLCLYDGRTDNGTMCFWHETEGKRGVDEVGSCLLADLRRKYQPVAIGGVRTLVCWSDRCRGQNNNWQMVCLFLYLLKERLFTKVIQKFLVSGHSFMPCDRMFGSIEKKKESSSVNIAEDWVRVILSAQDKKPFDILRIRRSLIKDVKSLEVQFPRPTSLKISEIAWIEVDARNPSALLTRPDHCPGAPSLHSLLSPRQTRRGPRAPLCFAGPSFVLPQKYLTPIQLSIEKQNDIRSTFKFLTADEIAFFTHHGC